jgi:gluconate 2-dehydrogenase gamma chain
MNRRDAVKLTTLVLGASLSAPVMFEVLQSCSPNKTGDLKSSSFSNTHGNLISEIAESIIPKTDTPGAMEAGVPDFIEKFVQNVYTDDQRKRFMDGLDAMDDLSKKKYGKKFLKISDEEKTALIESMNREALADNAGAKDPRNGPFILMIKEITLLGFFTSMSGATQTLQYLPIPGRFNGCMPLSEVGRAWATD